MAPTTSRTRLASHIAALGAAVLALTAAAEPDAGTPAAPDETTVRAPRLRREVGATGVAAEEARHLPLAMGDTLAVVQSLPGVARAPAGSGALVVWGSAPPETRLVIDDVPVPWLYHRGGLRSALADALVGSVDLVPAGFGPDQGRATGALVRVGTSTVPEEGLGSSLGADFIDGAASLRYRQADGEGPHAVAVGGRLGWLSRLLPLVAPDLAQTVPLPESWDYGGKWLLRAGGATTQVLVLGAGDEVARPFVAGGGERSSTWFHRGAVRHQQALAGGGWVEAGLWAGADRSTTALDFGDTRAAHEVLALRAGARASLRQALAPGLALTLGVDLEGSRTELARQGSLSAPAREGDLFVFGQPPGDKVSFDQWTTHALGAAAFAELELALGRVFTLRPGLRLEPFVLEGERLLPRRGGGVDVGYSRLEFFAEPRLSALLRPVAQLSVSAAVGLYHQPPDARDLSAVFGNPALGSATGFHALLGASVRPLEQLTLEATGYYKAISGLAARSEVAFPAVAQALVGTGEGRSYGGMLVLRPAAWRWLSGWASYGLGRSERRAGPDAGWRLLDFDQTHQFMLVASVALPAGFRVGPRLRAATGAPRTPVTGAVFDARTGGYQPVRGPQNSVRLPTFFQLDLRAEKTFAFSELALTFWLDVVNVTNTPNPEELAFSHDYQQQQHVTGLPLLAVLGARVDL